jgi:hypothetical protein
VFVGYSGPYPAGPGYRSWPLGTGALRLWRLQRYQELFSIQHRPHRPPSPLPRHPPIPPQVRPTSKIQEISPNDTLSPVQTSGPIFSEDASSVIDRLLTLPRFLRRPLISTLEVHHTHRRGRDDWRSVLEPICRTFSRLFVRYSVWEGFEGVVPSPGWDVSLFLLFRSFIDFTVISISWC